MWNPKVKTLRQHVPGRAPNFSRIRIHRNRKNIPLVALLFAILPLWHGSWNSLLFACCHQWLFTGKSVGYWLVTVWVIREALFPQTRTDALANGLPHLANDSGFKLSFVATSLQPRNIVNTICSLLVFSIHSAELAEFGWLLKPNPLPQSPHVGLQLSLYFSWLRRGHRSAPSRVTLWW